MLINTIGPVWDGNEVWLITAGGAMFAAFPEWYATLFSGFYLPLLLILLALIVRGVAFEYRGKRPDARPGGAAGTVHLLRLAWCPRCCGASRSPTSCAACRSTPTTSTSAACCDLLNPYALLGGLTTLALFLTHGAVFLALKTTGEIRDAGQPLAGRVGLWPRPCSPWLFLAWTLQHPRQPRPPSCSPSRAAVAPGRPALAANRVRPGGLGVRRHGRRDRAGGGDAVRRAVPRRDALHDWTRPTA